MARASAARGQQDAPRLFCFEHLYECFGLIFAGHGINPKMASLYRTRGFRPNRSNTDISQAADVSLSGLQTFKKITHAIHTRKDKPVITSQVIKGSIQGGRGLRRHRFDQRKRKTSAPCCSSRSAKRLA